MNIIVSIDSFKGCLSSIEAGETVKEAVLQKHPSFSITVYPLADGGEGTVEAMVAGLGGEIEHLSVTGPLGAPVDSRYGYLPETETAVIEMADASGLPIVPMEKRNPLHTSTYGLGELILAATRKGCRHFIIGIGGSATNDCGLGMMTALGARFLKADGTPCGFTGGDLKDVASIDLSGIPAEVMESEFSIACDVTNPLCGENGCSHVYGPQKGATPEIVARMDADIERFAEIAEKTLGKEAKDLPGAGAAGGLGFAFHMFLGGKLIPGADLILSTIPGLKESLAKADVLITGEGRMDEQSAMGKGPVGIAQLAKKMNPKCHTVALCGSVTDGAEAVNKHGMDAFFPILPAPMTLEEAMNPTAARRNLGRTARQVIGLLCNGGQE